MTEKRLRKRGLFGRKTVATFLHCTLITLGKKYKVDDKNRDFEDVIGETW